MARIGRAVFAAVLALVAVPAASRAEPPDHQAWVISPTTDTSRRLTPKVTVADVTPGAAILFVAFPAVSGKGSERRPAWQNGSRLVEVQGGNTVDARAVGIGPAVACSWVGCQPEDTWTFDTSKSVKDDYLLVTRNLRVVSVTPGTGWRAIRVSDTTFETTTGDASPGKAYADRSSVEWFTSATLDGRGHSAALAIIPCGDDGTSGSGSAVLSWQRTDRAGEHPAAYVMCQGQNEDQWRTLAVGTGPITWTLSGRVVGLSYYRTRLAVLAYSP